MFKGKKGKQLVAEIGQRSKTFVPGAPAPAGGTETSREPVKPDVQAIKVTSAEAAISMIFALQISYKSFKSCTILYSEGPNYHIWKVCIEHFLLSYEKLTLWF